MNTFTIDGDRIDISEHKTLRGLRADGRPTGIFVTAAEEEALLRVSPNVSPSVLEAMFESSPDRLVTLHQFLHAQ